MHVAGAWVVIAGNMIAGGWALVAHRRPSWRVPALWRTTAAAQVGAFIEAIIGVLTMKVDDIEATDFHLLYGFSTLFAVGILYAYRTQLLARQYLLYGFGGLFIAGLGLRAIIVGW